MLNADDLLLEVWNNIFGASGNVNAVNTAEDGLRHLARRFNAQALFVQFKQ